MAKPDRRRSPRVAVWLRTTLRFDEVEEQVFTGELGLRGAFVVTDNPPPPRQLLSVKIVLPKGEVMDLNGLAVRTVPPEVAREREVPPGVGVQLYGMSRETRQQWEEVFFDILTGRCPRLSPAGGLPSKTIAPSPSTSKKASLVIVPDEEPGEEPEEVATLRREEPIPLVKRSPQPEAPEGRADDSWASWYEYFHGQPINNRRESGRTGPPAPEPNEASTVEEGPSAPDTVEGPPIYRIALTSVVALRAFADQAHKAGGVFVRGVEHRATGTSVILCVVHPLNGDELHLPAEVSANSPGGEGVAVVFPDSPGRTLAGIHRFIELGATTTDPRTRRSRGDEARVPAAKWPSPTPPPRSSDAEDAVELSIADLLFVDDDEN